MVLRNHEPDVTVAVGIGESAREFECYQLLLSMSSEVFDAMLSSSMKERHSSRIELPDRDPTEWELFYSFLDPTVCRDAKIDTSNVMKLVPWFHRFQIGRLLKECDEIMESYLFSKAPQNWRRLTEAQFEKLIKWADFSCTYQLPLTSELSSSQIRSVLRGFHDCVTLRSLRTLSPLLADNDIVWDCVREYLPADAAEQQAPSSSSSAGGGNGNNNNGGGGGPFADRVALSQNPLLPHLLDSGLRRKRETAAGGDSRVVTRDSRVLTLETQIADALVGPSSSRRPTADLLLRDPTTTTSRCLREVRSVIARYKNGGGGAG